MVRAKASHQCYPGSNPSVDAVREGLNGVNRQPSNGLIFNRRPSKRLFFTVNRQKCTVILTVKAFQGIANLTISADIHGLLAPEESFGLKNHQPCCQKHSL